MKRFSTLTIVMILLFASLPLSVISVAESQEMIPAIVGFYEKPDLEVLKKHSGLVNHVFEIIPAIAVNLPKLAMENVKKERGVRYVELDSQVFSLQQVIPWGISRIKAPDTWSTTKGSGVQVAILDTGVEKDHADLSVNIAWGIGVVGYTNSTSYTYWKDGNGHGTYVSGIIAAVNNGIGVVGVAPQVSIYAIKVLSDQGSGTYSDVIEGIEWAMKGPDETIGTADDAEVISMSLGGTSNSAALHEAVDEAYAQGIVLVAAAGNSGDGNPATNNVAYPARYSSVIAVAATDVNDNIAGFSSDGPEVEVAAPGVSIKSTWIGNSYRIASGTSAACPHVSGTVALMRAVNPSLTPEQIRSVLWSTADQPTQGGTYPNVFYGYGIVRADKALAEILDTTPPTKVEGLTVTAMSESQLDLAWNPATDDVAMDHYNVYRGATSGFTPSPVNLVASPTTNSYSDKGLIASTTYYYRISAVDTSGNEGAPSDEALATTLVDLIGPSTLGVAVSPNPTNGATSVTLTATIDDSATGNSIITSAEYFVNAVGADGSGTPMSPSDGTFDSSTEKVTLGVDVSAWAADSYTLYVHGKDSAGNWGPSKSVVLQVSATITEKTYSPQGVSIIKGTITSGNYVSLRNDDGAYLAIKSAMTGYIQLIDWYSYVKILETPSKVVSLTITYDGKYSVSRSQTLYIYNFASNRWEKIYSSTVGTSDKKITWSTSSPSNYISNKGVIGLRVYTSGISSFKCYADFVSYKIKYSA